LLAGLGDVLAHIAPEATAVLIIKAVLKLISQAVKDKDQWQRLMWLIAPLLILVAALVGVAVWWTLDDGGLQLILHGIGPTSSRSARR
jgi:hypothetical protein